MAMNRRLRDVQAILEIASVERPLAERFERQRSPEESNEVLGIHAKTSLTLHVIFLLK
jgi:hypothetical protein